MVKESSRPSFAIRYKGEELYFSAPHLGTIGEYTDIEQMLKSKQPYEVLKILFRPVKWDRTGVEWTKVSDDVSVKYITNFAAHYENYEVEKYDADRVKKSKFGQADWWDDFPSNIYAGIVDFIAGIGMSSLMHFNLYSQNTETPEMKPEEGEGTDEELDTGWGWFPFIFSLAESDILKITGDTSITDVSFRFGLQYIQYMKYNKKIRDGKNN